MIQEANKLLTHLQTALAPAEPNDPLAEGFALIARVATDLSLCLADLEDRFYTDDQLKTLAQIAGDAVWVMRALRMHSTIQGRSLKEAILKHDFIRETDKTYKALMSRLMDVVEMYDAALDDLQQEERDVEESIRLSNPGMREEK